MPRGGKRKGTGRPKISGENREPTKTVRVPLSFAEKIPELLKKHQEENSLDDLQLPAKAHEKYLPLEGLAWDAFEAFCLDLIARFLKPKEIYHYGTQGNAQEGVDIVADLNNGEKWAFQCKQWQRFNRSDVTKVIERAKKFEADRYILFLSRVAGVEVRKVIANSPTWEVWDVRDISQKVRELPLEIARRLVRDHFHPEWQNAFLEVSKLTPFVSYNDFFYSWLNAERLFNHTWKLEGRDDALKSLHDFVTSSEKQVAILPGRGGIGKTKLLYEFAKTFEYPNFRLWFVEDNIPVTPENANNLPLHFCVIVLDDAHRREQDVTSLRTLIHHRDRSHHPKIKLVFSCRSYAVQSLQAQLDREGIDYLKLDELKELSRLETKALARQAIGQEYAHFAEQLAAIAYDSPLVTVVGGQLLAERAIPLKLLERNEDFRRTVLNRFQDILIGQVNRQIHPEICKKILELIAAVSPVQLTDEKFQQAATEFIGIDRATLIHSLGILEQTGVLLRRGNNLRITPDVLADNILHKACLTEQRDSTGYTQAVFEIFREIEIYPTHILRNLAELDWRVRFSSGQETNLLNVILQSFREEFRQASNLDRCKLLDLLKEIAYYQPEFSLEIVQFAMRHPTMLETENIAKQYHFTHLNVLSKLPKILKQIAYTLDYVPICCNFLWQLGRDDTSRPYNNPPESIRILIDLAKYGIDKSLKFNWQVLEAIERWLQEPHAHDHIYSPLDILDALFKKDIEHNDYDGRSLQISTFLVDREITQAIRKKALELIENLLNLNNIKVVLRALDSSIKALEELHDRSSQSLEEANQWWESEQLEILEKIHALVTRAVEPLIQLKVIEKLDWYARRSYSSRVRQKARQIIFSIPKTEYLKLTGALSGNYQWDWQEENFQLSWERREKYICQILESLASGFLEKYALPQEGIKILNERLQIISENNGRVSTRFLELLSELNQNYSIAICEQILDLGDCPLAPYIASMLYRAREFDIERAIKVFRDAVDSGKSTFCSSFAKNYWAWENNLASDELRQIVQKLLVHPELEVKKAAIGSLAILIRSKPQLAIDLALDVEIDRNVELAEELFQVFSTDLLDSLTKEELEVLLHKLEFVDRLSGYHICEFLVYISQKLPSFILQLILRRIEASVGKDELNYQPFPSSSYENCLHYLSSAEEYGDMLREIRELWFDCESQKELFFLEKNRNSASDRITALIKEQLYKELYKEVSLTYIEKSSNESKLEIAPTSIELLKEWIQTGDEIRIKAVSNLINRFHAGLVFNHFEFVTDLIERAFQVSDRCYEAVSSNLFIVAVSGTRMGIQGEPFPEDIALRDLASEKAKKFFKGSPIRRFLDSLVKHAESDIEFQREMYEE